MMRNDDDRTVFVNIDKVMPEMAASMETAAPMETTTPREAAAPMETTASMETAAPMETTAPREAAAPIETLTEAELSEEVAAVMAEKEADTCEMQLEELYRKLGKAYYEGGFEDPLPELLPLFDQITTLRNQIKGIEETAAAQPNRCPGCGAELEEDAKFCGNCGYRVG